MKLTAFITLLLACFAADAQHAYSKDGNKKQKSSIVNEVVKAKSRKDFEIVLSKLGLLNRSDRYKDRVIDAAMKVPSTRRLKTFYIVQKSSAEPEYNNMLFDVYADVPENEIEALYQASALLFPFTDNNINRSDIIFTLKTIGNEKRLRMAKYISGILPMDAVGVSRVISAIVSIPEDDIPDVIGRTLTVYDSVGDDGAVELMDYISQIPKERRDFIFEASKKLEKQAMTPISKAHLIHGLSKIKTEEFNEIVSLASAFFFENTTGGHMSLIFRDLEKSVSNELRPGFIKQVRPLLTSSDSSRTRQIIVCVLAKLSEKDRKIFLGYLPASMRLEIKKKIFDELAFIASVDIQFREKDKAKEQALVGRLISYYQEQLGNQNAVSEEKFLATTLSAVQYAKLGNSES